jgi:hypothetical protein
VLLTPPLSPAEWPIGPASVSLPNTTIEVVRLSQISVDEHATLSHPKILISECEPFSHKKLKISKKNSFILT